jgi:hypothetical protein
MAATRNRAFRQQLKAYVEDAKSQHRRWVLRVAEAAQRAAYEHTPIDTSRAMSGWVAQVDSPFLGEPQYTAGSKGSTFAEAVHLNESNISDVARDYRFAQKIYIRNNVPYIEILNSGEGSRQAPNGMMPFALDAAYREMT